MLLIEKSSQFSLDLEVILAEFKSHILKFLSKTLYFSIFLHLK